MLRALGLGGKKRIEPVVSDISLQSYIDDKFKDQNNEIYQLKEKIKILTESVKGEGGVISEISNVRNLIEGKLLSGYGPGDDVVRKISVESQAPKVPRLTSAALKKLEESEVVVGGNIVEGKDSRNRLTSYEREELFFDATDALPSARGENESEQLQHIADELCYSFDASKAVFVCEVLNDVAGEVPIVGSIVGILTTIFEKIEEAQTNKGACEALGSRIFDLSIALKDLLRQEKHMPGMMGVLRKLKNKLNEASEFIGTFSNRGWLKALLKGSSDAEAFKGIEEDLSNVIGDVQFQVMAKMAGLQGKMYDNTNDINENVKRLIQKVGVYDNTAAANQTAKALIENVGGVQGLGKDVVAAKRLADELGVTLEEIQGEACAEAAERNNIERKKVSPKANVRISPSLVKHRGFREFWEAKLSNRKMVNLDDLKVAMTDYMTDLELDAALIKGLTGEENWAKISRILDEDGNSIVSLAEVRRTFNTICAKDYKNDNFVSGLRSIIDYSNRKKSAHFNHLKPILVTPGKGEKKKFELVGRSAEATILVKALLSSEQNDNFHAIEICGADGVGKTFFCNSVCRLAAVQQHFVGGLYYVSLDATGSEVQRSAQTAQEVAVSVISAMNFDFTDVEIKKDPMKFLDKELAKRGKARSLLVMDGIDGDGTEAAFDAIAHLAGTPFVSAVLLTNEPLNHPTIFSSTRIMLDPLSYRDAVKLVQMLNPNLSRKSRKKVAILAGGNPASIFTLSQLSATLLEELHRAQKRRESTLTQSTTPHSSEGYKTSYIDPGSSFTMDNSSSAASPSKKSNTDNSENNPDKDDATLDGTADSSNLGLLYGGQDDESTDEKWRKMSLAAVKLGFEWPTPEEVKRASSDPTGKATSIRNDVAPLPSMPRLRKSRLALVEMGSPRATQEQDFTRLILSTLGFDEMYVLNLLSLVPSSWDMEYFKYCFSVAATKSAHEDGDKAIATRDTAEEMLDAFRRKGFVDIALADYDRLQVCRRWKKALLRSLLVNENVLIECKVVMRKFYTNLLVEGSRAWTGGGEGSWLKDEGLLKVGDDAHNIVSVLREISLGTGEGLYEDGVKVFSEAKGLLKEVLDAAVFEELVTTVEGLKL